MVLVCNLTFITCVVGWWPLQSPSLDMGSRSNRDKSLFSMNFFSYVCLFVCLFVYTIHLSWTREVYCVNACLTNPIRICSIPKVPKVPPHPKVYREVRVMINEQDWSSSLSLTPRGLKLCYTYLFMHLLDPSPLLTVFDCLEETLCIVLCSTTYLVKCKFLSRRNVDMMRMLGYAKCPYPAQNSREVLYCNYKARGRVLCVQCVFSCVCYYCTAHWLIMQKIGPKNQVYIFK